MANFVLELLAQYSDGLPFRKIYNEVSKQFNSITVFSFKSLMCKYLKGKIKKVRSKQHRWIWKLNEDKNISKIKLPPKDIYSASIGFTCKQLAKYTVDCLLKGQIPILDKYSKCYTCHYFKQQNGQIWCDVGGLEGQVFDVNELIDEAKKKSTNLYSSFAEFIRQLRKARKCELIKQNNSKKD